MAGMLLILLPPSLPLLFLKNRMSSAKFLVDTGASVSVFPHLPRSPSAPGSGIQLRTADGSPTNVHGSCRFYANPGIRFLMSQSSSGYVDYSTLEYIPDVASKSSNSSSDLYTALLSTPEEFFDLLSPVPRCSILQGFLYLRSKASSLPYCSYLACPTGVCQSLLA